MDNDAEPAVRAERASTVPLQEVSVPPAGVNGHSAPAGGDRQTSRFNLKTFESLKYRDYRLLWTSIVFMSGGMWMQQIAQSWLVYQMTDSPFILGAINGVSALPFLFLGPWAGVAADRFDRKMLMLVSQAYILVTTLVMALLIISGLVEVWHLFVFSLLSSIGWSFTQPVRQTLVPNLVPREDMVNAVALQSAGFNSMRILGPALAGLVIAWVGPGGAFMGKAVAYAIILALIWVMRVPPTPAQARHTHAFENLKEGFRYIGSSPALFSLIVLAIVPMVLVMPTQTLMPVFARDILEMDAMGYGVLMSFGGVGALTGTLIVASLGRFKRKGLLLLCVLTALGVSLVLFSRSTWLPASLFLIVFFGGFQMTYMSLSNTLVHLNTDDSMRGRVMSIYMLDHGLTPLGALFAGTVAQLAGAPLAVTIMGTSCVLLALVAIARSPVIRRLA